MCSSLHDEQNKTTGVCLAVDVFVSTRDSKRVDLFGWVHFVLNYSLLAYVCYLSLYPSCLSFPCVCGVLGGMAKVGKHVLG